MLLLLACTASKDTSTSPVPIPQEPALALVSDTSNQRITLTRLDQPTEVATINLLEQHPELCDPNTPCLVFGSQHDLDPSTQDDLITALYEPIGVSTHLEQFRITQGKITSNWHLETLDFSAHPELCPVNCPDAHNGGDLPRGCFLSQSHSFVILEDTPTQVKAVIADTGSPDRLVWITLDKSKTCATVDRTSPLEPYEHTNDVETWTEDGRNFILLSHFAASDGPDQAGASKITLHEDNGTTLTQLWEYPEDGYLSAAHNPDRIVENDQTYIIFAHSNGNGTSLTSPDWTPKQDHLGTISVLSLPQTDQIPLYLGEITTPNLGFIRDTAYHNGHVLVTDSGCFNENVKDCPHEPALWDLPLHLADFSPTGLSGSFGEQQQITEVPPNDGYPIHCGYALSYSAEYLVERDLGPGLSARMTVNPGTCQ